MKKIIKNWLVMILALSSFGAAYGAGTTPFVTVWKVPASGSITIPVSTTGTNINITVKDGITSTSYNNVTSNITINGLTPGNMDTIEIIQAVPGGFPHFDFAELTPQEKANLKFVLQWGDNQWKSMSNAFSDATELNVIATDVPDLSQVKNCSGMFYNNKKLTGFNGSVNCMLGWDMSGVQTTQSMFYQASIFNNPAVVDWDMGSDTTLATMFMEAKKFNQDISGWNTSNVVNMNQVFRFADAFDQNICQWDIRNVRTMIDMFETVKFDRGMSCENMGKTFYGWATWTSLKNNVTLGINNRTIPSNVWNDFVQDVFVSTYGWTLKYNTNGIHIDSTCATLGIDSALMEICYHGAPIVDTSTDPDPECLNPELEGSPYFVTKWNTGTGDYINIPANTMAFPGQYNYEVSYQEVGNPTINFYGTFNGPTSITGLTAGTDYVVYIGGDYPHFSFSKLSLADRAMLLEVMHWGNIEWKSMSNAFTSAVNMELTACDVPNLSEVTTMSGMFYNCTSLTGAYANWNWNLETITNMQSVFYQANVFNGDISVWDPVSAKTMASIFYDAFAFNQDISGWNVGSVENMNQAFRRARSFNYDLGCWDMGNVTSAVSMFSMDNAPYAMTGQNFSNTITCWGNQTLKPNVNFGFLKMNYFPGAESGLVANTWNITQYGNGTVGTAACNCTTSPRGVYQDNKIISVYPNPTNGSFTIEAELGANYMITDIYGRIIEKGQLTNGSAQFDLSKNAKGTYFIKVNDKVSKVILK